MEASLPVGQALSRNDMVTGFHIVSFDSKETHIDPKTLVESAQRSKTVAESILAKMMFSLQAEGFDKTVKQGQHFSESHGWAYTTGQIHELINLSGVELELLGEGKNSDEVEFFHALSAHLDQHFGAAVNEKKYITPESLDSFNSFLANFANRLTEIFSAYRGKEIVVTMERKSKGLTYRVTPKAVYYKNQRINGIVLGDVVLEKLSGTIG